MVPKLLNKFYPICKKMIETEKSNTKVKELFGGKVRRILTGEAPTGIEDLSFFKSALECELRKGYGQTETTAVAFMMHSGDTNFGHVDGPN
jgi:long-chain acyl-CoA synthetase